MQGDTGCLTTSTPISEYKYRYFYSRKTSSTGRSQGKRSLSTLYIHGFGCGKHLNFQRTLFQFAIVLEKCSLVKAKTIQRIDSRFATVLPCPIFHCCECQPIGRHSCTLRDLKYLGLCANFLFISSHDNVLPVNFFLMHTLYKFDATFAPSPPIINNAGYFANCSNLQSRTTVGSL